jgi:hypothetical protein
VRSRPMEELGQEYLKCIADCMWDAGCDQNNPDWKT